MAEQRECDVLSACPVQWVHYISAKLERVASTKRVNSLSPSVAHLGHAKKTYLQCGKIYSFLANVIRTKRCDKVVNGDTHDVKTVGEVSVRKKGLKNTGLEGILLSIICLGQIHLKKDRPGSDPYTILCVPDVPGYRSSDPSPRASTPPSTIRYLGLPLDSFMWGTRCSFIANNQPRPTV